MPCLLRAETLPKPLTHSYLLPDCAHHGSHGHVPLMVAVPKCPDDLHILLLSHGNTGIQAKPPTSPPPARQPVALCIWIFTPMPMVCHSLNTLNTHFVKKLK